MKMNMKNNFKTNIPIDKFRERLNEIWDSMEYITDFGHVGCYEMSKDEVQLRSKFIMKQLAEVELSFDLITDAIKESYGH